MTSVPPTQADPQGPPTLSVEVWVDVVCPWCFLGKRRLEAAVHRFEHPAAVEVRYRSFELDRSASPGGGRLTLDVLAERRGVDRTTAASMLRQVSEAAAQEGIPIEAASMPAASSFDAHRLVQLALASGGLAEQSAVLERLFSAHLCEGRAVDDVATLQRLAAEAGLDERRVAAVLAADDYAEQVRADEALAERLGIAAVPHLRAAGIDMSGAQPVDTVLEALRSAWGHLATR